MLSGQECCENHPSLIQVTVSGNAHPGPGQFWTLGAFRPRSWGKNSHRIHTKCTAGTSQLLHWVQRTEGRVEDRAQQPALQFLFCPEQDAPIVLNHVKKKQPTELLFSKISHRRKELRLSNLIHLGLLCLNPWSRVFNQLRGGRGRQLCVGSPGRRRVGEGQSSGPTELPPSLRGASQALLHTSFQQCKAAWACRSSQDTNDN